jgi:hypothetical protein
MCLDDPARELKQNGRCGVERSKVWLTAGDFREAEPSVR